MQDLQVSVGLVLYNEEKRILELLKSLEEQSIGLGSFEVIVVDNDSSDSTLSLVKDFQSQTQLNLGIIERKENNIGAGRADIINAAKADLVAFIDGDCFPSATWISELTHQFSNHKEKFPELAACGSSAVYSEEHYFARCIYSMSKVFMGHLNSNQIRRVSETLVTNHTPTSNVCYDRKKVIDVGNFSSRYPKVCEDVELNFRLKQAGHSLLFLPSPTVIHQVSPNPLKWFMKIFKYGSGQFLVIDEHPTHFQFRLLLPLLFIFAFVSWIILMISDVRFLWLAWVYLAVVTAQSLRAIGGSNEIVLFPGLISAFFITHLAYSMGELYGFIRYLLFKLSGVRQ